MAKNTSSPKSILVTEIETYYKTLDTMRIDLMKTSSPKYLNVSYLLFCAATLEYTLNITYVRKCNILFHKDVNEKLSKAFIEHDVKTRIIMAPIILSNNEFRFNEKHKVIYDIKELIASRNKILHKKNYFESPSFDKAGAFKINLEFDKITEKDKCLKYGEALNTLKVGFFDPILDDRLKETDFLIKN